MRIPNCSNVEVQQRKVVDYLLSTEHPEGESKARFFLGCGFSRDKWEVLASALAKQAEANDYSQSIQGRYGTKYVIVGPILAPNGTTPPIWIIADDKECARLITAYPLS
jgi:hypothetical protein